MRFVWFLANYNGRVMPVFNVFIIGIFWFVVNVNIISVNGMNSRYIPVEDQCDVYESHVIVCYDS